MSDLRFDLHGLAVSINVEDPGLRSFIAAHFEAEEGANPDAEVLVRTAWHWGSSPVPGFPAMPEETMRRVGGGAFLYRGRDDPDDVMRAVWSRVADFPELTMRFQMGGVNHCRLRVRADCSYVPRGVGRRIRYLRPTRVDRKKHRLFFKLMYFMIYYPVAWHLECIRGWGLLHACAVAMPSGKAILLAGQGGVGKSTLGLALLSTPGAKLISDNLVFHDETRVYACPEPVRLEARAVASLAEAGFEPQRSAVPLGAHPKPTFRVGPARRVPAAVPAAAFIMRRGRHPGSRRLGPDQMAEMLRAGNDLAREIKDLRPCAALLTTMAAERGRPRRARRASLERLLGEASCGIFTIGEGETVAAAAARLTEVISEPA
ncbi:MAG: hypothetical protein ACE5HU_00930 [Acidobacteriota bacterium]